MEDFLSFLENTWDKIVYILAVSGTGLLPMLKWIRNQHEGDLILTIRDVLIVIASILFGFLLPGYFLFSWAGFGNGWDWIIMIVSWAVIWINVSTWFIIAYVFNEAEFQPSITEKSKKAYTFLINHNAGLQLFISIIALFISIIAISLSIKGINDSEKNSQNADSLFKVQLAVMNQQLKMTTQTLDDQVFQHRPIIIVEEITIEDATRIIDGKLAPLITGFYKNVGKRFAYNIQVRFFAITNDLKEIRQNDGVFFNAVGPDNTFRSSFLPKLPNSENPFYLCLDIISYDSLQETTYCTNIFYTYEEFRGVKGFSTCNPEKVELLTKKLNKELEYRKLPPLGKYIYPSQR